MHHNSDEIIFMGVVCLTLKNKGEKHIVERILKSRFFVKDLICRFLNLIDHIWNRLLYDEKVPSNIHVIFRPTM